jgi:hypothetical protein
VYIGGPCVSYAEAMLRFSRITCEQVEETTVVASGDFFCEKRSIDGWNEQPNSHTADPYARFGLRYKHKLNSKQPIIARRCK